MNNEIRSTASELKNVERLLKLDPKNTELLAQKQKLLTDAVEETKKKETALKDAVKQVQEQYARGDATEEQLRAVQRELISATNAAKGYEEQLKKCNSSAEKMSAALSEFGEKATKAGKALAPLSAAAAGIAGGMITAAVKAGTAADDLNTLSKQTGLSTESLQKFAYASDRIDVSTETLTGALSKMVKSMSSAKKGSGDSAAAFKELGVHVTDSHGKLRDSETVFYDTISALEKMKNETERDSLAMAIFGKSAQQLNPLILGGADALKQYGEEAKAAGLILSQDTLDAANAFNDEIDETKAKLQATFLVLGSKLATALTPSLEKITEAISALCEWLASLDPNILAAILSIVALTAAIAPMLIAIGKISTGISALNTAMVALSGNPMVMMITAAVAIAAALVMLEQKTQIFSRAFTAVWNGAYKLVERVGSFFVNIFTVKIPNALKKMQDFFKSVFNGLVDIIKAPINLVIQGINWLIDGINALTKKLNTVKIPSWLGGGTLGGNSALMPHLPLLANGGVVTHGSAIVGERGAELLTVNNGKATVQPLTGDKSVSALGTTINMTINSSDIKSVADFWRTVQNAKRLERMA